MARCFVTGGTGFIGHFIVKTLIENGHDVTVLIRSESKLDLIEGLGAKTVIGDITDAQSLEQGISEDTEWLFHNAAIMKDWGGPANFVPINVEGTRNILEIVRKKDIPQLHYTSSTAVYGFPNKQEPMDENYPWNPMKGYQLSKAESEMLVREYAGDYDIKSSIVRPPMVLGHGDMYTGPLLIQYLKNEKMVTFGGG
ncbi:MAG: NAD-dependent epimerase/dehydratase family protein, partial [Candidatus Thorarchaeota archaeon]